MKQLEIVLKSMLDMAFERKVATSLALAVDSGPMSFRIFGGLAEPSTIFDLASLTKIIGTTLGYARLVADGKLDLRAHPFPSWPRLTIADLLSHRCGLPAHIKLYEASGVGQNFTKNQGVMLKKLFEVTPQEDRSRLYSDLSFMALGHLLEKSCHKPLIDVFRQNLNEFLGEHAFTYFPSNTSARVSLPHIAPTGICPIRQVRVRGQVHDLNCFFMGGISGHAGLFGDLASVAKMGRRFLAAYQNPKSPLEHTLKMFAKKRLGFDKREPGGTLDALSPDTFGHFGFTGVSLWMDPRLGPHGTSIALLTNRVDQSLSPHGIYWLRKKVHQTIFSNS